MMRCLARLEPLAYDLLRLFSGAMLSVHGMQKLFGVLTSKPVPAPFSQAWIGGVIELLCGVLIALGLFTRPAAFLASGTMAVAYFQFHWKFQMDDKFFPIINKGEPAVLYCFLFLHMACRGGVKWCIDKK